jgi:hypothetical protein
MRERECEGYQVRQEPVRSSKSLSDRQPRICLFLLLPLVRGTDCFREPVGRNGVTIKVADILICNMQLTLADVAPMLAL